MAQLTQPFVATPHDIELTLAVYKDELFQLHPKMADEVAQTSSGLSTIPHLRVWLMQNACWRYWSSDWVGSGQLTTASRAL
jgi:hypothetical protein